MRVSLLVAAGLVALAIVFVSWVRAQSGYGPTIRVSEVARAIADLRQHGGEHAFLVFMFDSPGQVGAEAINLQLSIDKGRLGLDWVLLSPSNLADRAKVESFIRKRGHAVRDEEMNGVRFLRVENGDLTALAKAILAELYELNGDAEVETVVEGFKLSPSR